MKYTFTSLGKPILIALFVFSFRGAFGSLEPSSEWERTGKKAGIDLFHRQSAGSDIFALKGIGEIEAPLWKVAATLLDTERASEWVDSLERSSVVRRLDFNTYIEYNHIRTPFFMKDRDFVSVVKILVDPNEKTFTLRYEPSEEPAGSKDHIRGLIQPGVFHLKALSKQRTLLEGEVNCDPKGGIPKWLVNFIQSDWAYETITALRSQTARPDLRIPAEFSDILKPTLKF